MVTYNTSVRVLPDFAIALLEKKKEKNKQKHIYAYNDFFFYKIPLVYNDLHSTLDEETNSIVFNHLIKNVERQNNVNPQKHFLYSLDNYYYEKLRFAGKGYRVVLSRKKKCMKFKFGHSHKKLIFFRFLKIKKSHKYKFSVMCNDRRRIVRVALLVRNVKPINLYTKRGVRRCRQVLFWKKKSKID
jgi:hypothetical protein